MATIKAKQKSTSESGKKFAKSIRNEGRVPAVVYGEKKDPVAITVDPVEFMKELNKSDYKKNQVFELNIDDNHTERVITKEIKVNPINNQFIHIDFFRVDDAHPIQVNVPIRTTGISAGQRVGGVLVTPKRVVKVECLPNDIPVDIGVDVSGMGIGDNIRVQDLNVTGSQTVISNPKDILIKVESTKLSKTATAGDDNGASTDSTAS
jgi:large subunit ribosomal protein L25